MSSAQELPLDLSALNDRYEIVGEYAALGQNRRYPGRRREDSRDVLITVLAAAPDVGQGKAIAQFAADANLMVGLSHPNVPQVLEARWVGDGALALVTDRVHGMTLAEVLRGDRLPKPRIADILADVDGVLEWARNERLSHRGVTPDSIWIERGTKPRAGVAGAHGSAQDQPPRPARRRANDRRAGPGDADGQADDGRA
jgi:serine/threonine protein kinase